MTQRGDSVRCLAFVAGSILSLSIAASRADIWRTGYYPGYHQGTMPASNIDFVAITHVIHFSLVPRTDGSLDSTANVITPAYSQDVVSRAHAAGRKVLICVGGVPPWVSAALRKSITAICEFSVIASSKPAPKSIRPKCRSADPDQYASPPNTAMMPRIRPYPTMET